MLRGDYLCLVHFITLTESIIVTILYVKILILAKKHAKKLWKQRQIVSASRLNVLCKMHGETERSESGNYVVKQTTARGVKILFFLIVVYVTTKLPMKVCNAIQYRFWTKQSIFALNVSEDFFYMLCATFSIQLSTLSFYLCFSKCRYIYCLEKKTVL